MVGCRLYRNGNSFDRKFSEKFRAIRDTCSTQHAVHFVIVLVIFYLFDLKQKYEAGEQIRTADQLITNPKNLVLSSTAK